MKNQLTERQEEILRFIQDYLSEKGFPPTLREIGRKFGISSTFGVKRHLEALAKKGYINVESNASRGINIINHDFESSPTVLEENEIFHSIPLVGRVAAGTPVLAVENIEGSVVIDPSFMKRADDCFALRVKGDSMINAGIFEGDIVIVSPKQDATNGSIIVALIDDEATVKTFEKNQNKIRLIPENEKYPPIEIDSSRNFSIEGKVIGVLRWFN